jgi:CRISPR type I-E-associated protein CasB/Cse2
MEQKFVTYLLSLSKNTYRRDLVNDLQAAARSQHFPRNHPAVIKVVAPWQHDGTPRWVCVAQEIVTPLAILHPMRGDGNMGDHLRLLKSDLKQADRIFDEMVSVPSSEMPLLYQRLWGVVSRLRGAGVAVNWHQLYRDVQSWTHPEYRLSVIRRWTRSYEYKPKQEKE